MSARHRGALAVLLVVAGATYAAAAFGPPFFTKGEPREGVVVRMMVESGDYVLPRRLEREIPTKPPLFHWLGALASLAAGHVSEASVRAPSVLASLLVIAETAAAGSTAFDPMAGLAAALMLATSVQWIASSVTARVDMVYAAAVATAMLAFLRVQRGSRSAAWVAWGAIAAAVLAKGPVGVVLPLLVLACFTVVRGAAGGRCRLRPGIAVVALAVPLVWYALAWQEAGAEFVRTVVRENVTRMVAHGTTEVGHRRAALFYGPALLAGFAPWSLLVPSAIVSWWRASDHRLDDVRLYLVLWIVVTVGFFSLAVSKRSVYLLSCYPAIALLLGNRVARWAAGAPERIPRALGWLARGVALLTAVAAVVVALAAVGLPIPVVVGSSLSDGDRASTIAFFRAAQDHAPIVLAWAAGILGIVALGMRATTQHAWPTVFGATAAVVATTVGVLGPTVFRELATMQSVRPFAEAVAHTIPDGSAIAYYRDPHGHDDDSFAALAYAVEFYAGRPLHPVAAVDPSTDGRFITDATSLAALATYSPEGPGPLRDPTRYRVLARYTWGDDPHRAPLLLVEGSPPPPS